MFNIIFISVVGILVICFGLWIYLLKQQLDKEAEKEERIKKYGINTMDCPNLMKERK